MGAIERFNSDVHPPATLVEQAEKFVAKHQPELIVSTWKSFVCLEGKYILAGRLGEFDNFDVNIRVPASFPLHEPIIFETGGRIEKVADRHVCEDDGNCCVGVYEEWLFHSADHSLADYLLGPVDDYLLSQHWYEARLKETGAGEWPLGERSHGLAGVYEAFGDIIGVEADPKEIANYLRVLSKDALKGHFFCPCGSGKRLRNCHRDQIEELRERINPAMAKRMLGKLEAKSKKTASWTRAILRTKT